MLPTDGSLDHRHKGIAGDGPKIDYNDLINTPTTLTSKFGGTGANGALSISSGTTTVDCGAGKYKELNYTSLSITGTGALQFTNPHSQGTLIVIKVQGNLTVTTSVTGIDASGMGGAGGASVGGGNKNGLDGTLGSILLIQTNQGTGATGVLGPGTVGIGGAVPVFSIRQLYNPTKYFDAFVGAGGGSGDASQGGGGNASSGTGGRGGGALIIEVGGALNFTTANGITVAGIAGGNGSGTGNEGAGGGGGGGGGYCRIVYNSLTANTGTIVVSGGVAGTCSIGGGFAGFIDGGGGGGSMTAGTNGTTNNVNGATNGGPGGTGASSVVQNVEYT